MMYKRLLFRLSATAVFTGLIGSSLSVPHASASPVSATVNIDTTSPLYAAGAFNRGFGGYNVNILNQAWQYNDPNFASIASYLEAGTMRFVAGTASDDFNWKTGRNDPELVAQWGDERPLYYTLLSQNRYMASKAVATRFSDFKNAADAANSNIIVCINGFTDTPESAGDLTRFAKDNHIQVKYYELSNEPWSFAAQPTGEQFFNSTTDYINKMAPYAQAIKNADPGAKVTLMASWKNTTWNSAFGTYAGTKYWDAISLHSYQSNDQGNNFTSLMYNGNYNIYNNSTQLVDNLVASTGSNDIVISEYSMGGSAYTAKTEFEGIYNAEYAARMSADSHVKYVLQHMLTGLASANSNEGSEDDKLINAFGQGQTVDTSADGYSSGSAIYYTPNGLGMKLAGEAINHSVNLWSTTVTGGSTVPANDNSGIAATPVPSLYAQAYQGDNGQDYLVITNKSADDHSVTINVNHTAISGTLTEEYITSNDPAATNTSSAPNNISIQTATSTNSIVDVPPYSVVLVKRNDTGSVTAVAPVLQHAANVSGTKAKLQWAPIDPPPSGDSVGYIVKYGTTSGSYPNTVDVGNVTNYTIVGLNSSSTYYFAVSSYYKDSGGTIVSQSGGNSNELSTKLVAPSAPSGISAHPSDGNISVTWKDSPYATGYKVSYGTSPGNYSTTIDVGNAAGYVLNGLANGTAYYMAVYAYNSIGQSAASTEVQGAPNGDLPVAPNNVKVTGQDASSVTLGWSESNKLNYSQYFSAVSNPTDWTQISGTWSLVSDNGGTSTDAYRAGATSGSNAAVNNNRWTDSDIIVRIRPDSWNTSGSVQAGILAHYQDWNNYYKFIYDPVALEFRLIKRVNGSFQTIASKSLSAVFPMSTQISTGTYHEMEMHFQGNVIYCAFDRTKIFKVTDATFARGKVAFFTQNQTADFDLLEVYAPYTENYTIERSTSPDFTQNLTSVATSVSGTTYTDTGANSSGTYYYRLFGTNANGTSGYYSNVASNQ